jgi:transposase-like protein
MSANISISGEAQRRTRARRWFPQEYKDQVVAWYFATGKPVGQLAEELGLPESTLRDWIRRAKKAATESSSVIADAASDPAAEEETEIAWHGEPEEPFVASPGPQAGATWVYSPGRLEALLAEAPPIAEVAYKLGLTESALKAWVQAAAGELEPEATLDIESDVALDLEPEALTESEAVIFEPEAVIFEPEAVIFEPEAVTFEPENVTLEPEEPAPSVVSEPEPEPWTLVWRPPAEGQSTVDTTTTTTEWVHASGWTPSQARSAALSLLGNPDSETPIEVEFLQIPRHRLGGRVYIRARRRPAA